MDAQIRIIGGAEGELTALGEWLKGDEELRGRVRSVQGAVGETELGPVAGGLGDT